ncbi:hypothetical protein CSUB01_11849 [Colletotrichum sublineola]|uniref:DUF1348-domain-containing protein n=1 Tax=Colletotrichum sublineola TaxID=1173701 RepID=A0A066XCV3_COLSU|nr:hypothetical protein CSUB01_11849 [Colletotrichum sublineola]
MSSLEEPRPPFPPFTEETAQVKVKAAQDAWNTMSARPHLLLRVKRTRQTDPRVPQEPRQSRDQIEQWLAKKWEKEQGYRLRKELFAFTENKIAVQFWYEWHDESGQWWRTYGLEDWTFAENGLMRKRQMSGNDVKIEETQRWFRDGVDVNTVAIAEQHW